MLFGGQGESDTTSLGKNVGVTELAFLSSDLSTGTSNDSLRVAEDDRPGDSSMTISEHTPFRASLVDDGVTTAVVSLLKTSIVAAGICAFEALVGLNVAARLAAILSSFCLSSWLSGMSTTATGSTGVINTDSP